MQESRSVPVLILLGLFGLSVFMLMYWNYPFDGMVIEESWTLYTTTNPSGADFRTQNDNPWTWVFAKRGGVSLLRLLVVSLKSTPVFVNTLCIVIQLLNFVIFSYIAWMLAGQAWVFPILVVALLYPFASSAHYWQIGLLHHMSILFFLSACALYLRACWCQESNRRDLVLYGLAGLICFWLSLNMMEHGILMPVLLGYVALYHTNRRETLVHFRTFWSPSIVLALCYLAISVVFVGVILSSGHARLNFLSPVNSARFAEWAAAAHVPILVVRSGVMLANGLLFVTSTLVANTIGFLGYPLVSIADHARIVMEDAKLWGTVAAVAAGLGIYGLYALRMGEETMMRQGREARFLVVVGLIWAALCYLPLASSFAYPRMVGQSADRINALAFFGVSLCLGVTLGRIMVLKRDERLAWRSIKVAGVFAGILLLLLNLYLQREYWVEGYHKERDIIEMVLAQWGQPRADGRQPIVFLDREDKPVWVRVRLNQALKKGSDLGAKLFQVATVILGRHFTQAGEIETTSFHLEGVPLFGGAPDGAAYVFNNYAKMYARQSVPVYKLDNSVVVKEDGDILSVGYDGAPDVSFLKQKYVPVVITLEESFFRLRGDEHYRMRAGWPVQE